MIISIRDSQNNLMDGVAFTALLAGITAVSKSKKTLALQLTSNAEESIADVLIGRELKDTIKDKHSFQDEGLDSLLMRADTMEITKEHFDECVTPLLEKENMLDVLKPSRTDFKGIFSIDLLDNILKGTKEVYDYVYVFLPKDDAELIEKVTAMTDEDLIIVPQGIKMDVDLSNKKSYLVVKNFETTSKFDVASTKKKYNVKKLYPLMYNVGFRDAVISQTLLDFILLNKKALKKDDNYYFTYALKQLIDRYVLDKSDEDDDEYELNDKSETALLAADSKSVIPENAIQEVTVKKGLFGRKKKIMIDM